MNEHLYSVGLKHKETGERIELQVWAKSTDEATGKLVGTLIGCDCPYLWTGSGPIYKNNMIVTRKAKDT